MWGKFLSLTILQQEIIFLFVITIVMFVKYEYWNQIKEGLRWKRIEKK